MSEKKTQEAAAAAAAMSVRSARKWQAGTLPSETRKTRSWRTRIDPFADVWAKEIEPLLRADEDGVLQATTIFEVLEQHAPGKYSAGQLRSLQRRMRDWRALHGPEKEVYFEQKHVAGREAAVDFTHATDLRITILGKALRHLLFQLVLSFSGWRWLSVAFGETYEALVGGIQDALWALGGVPEVCRSDNLSAATHELKKTGGRALNTRFRGVLEHYGMISTRIRPGESHENGVVEQAHRRTLSAIDQALVLRGSRDFVSLDAYVAFIRNVVDTRFNRRVAARLAEERKLLRPLPSSRVPDYTTFHPSVRKWSTINVGGQIYSVPSRLIGHEVEARRHPDLIEVLFKGERVLEMPRLHGESQHRIDYRHVIWSLVRKPGAFARYRFREELFPSMTFRRAYDALRTSRGDRADVEYVRILHLAASTMESLVEAALTTLLEAGARVDYDAVRAIASPERPKVPVVSIGAPNLAAYDALIGGAR
ncbi:MAG: IS21 family transposase [Polyangiaceae bacterium]